MSKAEEIITKPKEEEDINKESENQLSPLQEAKQILEQIKKEKELLNIENKKREDINAREMLRGRAEAGSAPVKKEETPAEYRKRLLGY